VVAVLVEQLPQMMAALVLIPYLAQSHLSVVAVVEVTEQSVEQDQLAVQVVVL
jgi:hypothetical protein